MIKKCAGGVLTLLLFIGVLPLQTDAAITRTVRDARTANETLQIRDGIRGNVNVQRFRDDEIIVKYKGEDTFTRIPNTGGQSIDMLLSRFRSDDSVEYAEPNYIAEAFFVPNDSLYQYQWNFDNNVSGGVDAEEAWDITNGNGAIVAIIDTGVAYEDYYVSRRNQYAQAPDLANTTFVQGYDFVNNDSHPNDDAGHGTHVAGTIAQSTNNNNGTAGLAYGASIMPIKVLNYNGSGTYADVAEGIRYAADHGADVINMSLGGSTGTTYLEEALAYAHNKGVTIVAAAGNNGSGSISYPAAYNDYVIAVGATRFDETRAPYSNYGSALDIVAPGGDLDVDQNGDGYGDGVLQQTFGSSPTRFGYYFFEGTSMATPHVAAAAAMIIASGVATTPEKVQNVLQNSAKDLGNSGRDNTYGYGLLDIAAALQGAQPDPGPGPEPEVNDSPTITSNPVITGEENAPYSYDVNATDPNGDPLTYSLSQNPSGMSIDTASGIILWTPSTNQVGTHDVTVEVTDGDLTDSQSFEITVTAAPEDPPPPPPPDSQGALFRDSFENGSGNWTQDSQNDWRINDRRSTDGDNSLEVDGRTSDGTVTSIPIDLQGNNNIRVNLSMYLERSYDRGEYIAFDISTNGGSSWTEYARLRGNIDPENRWYDLQYDFAGISQLQLRFRGTASSGSEDSNVDNIVVIAL